MKKSFFDLPIGALFTYDDGCKTKRPFQKVGKNQFSRPNGRRKWIVFRPLLDNEPFTVLTCDQ